MSRLSSIPLRRWPLWFHSCSRFLFQCFSVSFLFFLPSKNNKNSLKINLREYLFPSLLRAECALIDFDSFFALVYSFSQTYIWICRRLVQVWSGTNTKAQHTLGESLTECQDLPVSWKSCADFRRKGSQTEPVFARNFMLLPSVPSKKVSFSANHSHLPLRRKSAPDWS